MKTSLSIALIFSAALLSACGGSSSKSKQSIAEFSLDSYEGRSVSSTSIAGTWVSVGEGERVESYDDFTSTYDIASKEYFIIRDSGFGYLKESCDGGSSTVIQTGDQIEFEGITGTLINNQIISGTRTVELAFSSYSKSGYANYNMVKISDSAEAIGSVELTEAGKGSSVVDVKCFQQKSEVETWTVSNDTYFEEIYSIGLIDHSDIELYKWNSDFGDSYFDIYAKNYSFYSDESNSVNFSVNSESNTAHNISFNGSNQETDINGTVQIQLPLQ